MRGAKGPVNLYISRSADGGATWTNAVVDVSGAPPDCSAYQCGWAYLGAQITMAGDEAGTLYALWNMGAADFGPERIYFARSTDGAASWSAKADVSSAPAGSAHAFPAVVAGNAGDVRIAWMDARGGSLWNTCGARASTTRRPARSGTPEAGSGSRPPVTRQARAQPSQVLMILRPALRPLMRPLPPGAFAARFLAAVILPPLLFFAMVTPILSFLECISRRPTGGSRTFIIPATCVA